MQLQFSSGCNPPTVSDIAAHTRVTSPKGVEPQILDEKGTAEAYRGVKITGSLATLAESESVNFPDISKVQTMILLILTLNFALNQP